MALPFAGMAAKEIFLNPKFLGAVAIVILLGAFYIHDLRMKNTISDLKTDVATAQQQIVQYENDLKEAERINLSNLDAIAQLEKDKENEKEVSNNLRKKLKTNSATTRSRIDIINQATDEDDGPVAPVLRNAIDMIQKDEVKDEEINIPSSI